MSERDERKRKRDGRDRHKERESPPTASRRALSPGWLLPPLARRVHIGGGVLGIGWGNGQGPTVNVRMTRMATEEIHDRRRMFELFTALKVPPPPPPPSFSVYVPRRGH